MVAFLFHNSHNYTLRGVFLFYPMDMALVLQCSGGSKACLYTESAAHAMKELVVLTLSSLSNCVAFVAVELELK